MKRIWVRVKVIKTVSHDFNPLYDSVEDAKDYAIEKAVEFGTTEWASLEEFSIEDLDPEGESDEVA